MRSLTRKSTLLPLALLPLLTACSKADVSGLGFEE